MQIFFVRHGETDFNKNEIFQGSEVDKILNSNGVLQSEKTGLYLKKYGLFDKIYSSPLSRAIETANIIKKHTNFNEEIIIDDNLIGKKFGTAIGAQLQ